MDKTSKRERVFVISYELCTFKFIVFSSYVLFYLLGFQDSAFHHVCVRCITIEVDVKKEAELMLALDTINTRVSY